MLLRTIAISINPPVLVYVKDGFLNKNNKTQVSLPDPSGSYLASVCWAKAGSLVLRLVDRRQDGHLHHLHDHHEIDNDDDDDDDHGQHDDDEDEDNQADQLDNPLMRRPEL